MTDHQWMSMTPDDGSEYIVTTITEMTAVLKCAASLADIEGMRHTAQRLRNDAERVRELYDEHGALLIEVR